MGLMSKIEIKGMIDEYEHNMISIQKTGIEALKKAYSLEIKQNILQEISGLTIDEIIEKFANGYELSNI